ncbi:hypothetical protein EV426DRAFT_665148 [Tirmania nivea]|nr:hypothetical protein EV426DRAFT_665148 [Tirmania nivea]
MSTSTFLRPLSPPLRINLLFDFDSTLTTSDTLSTLALLPLSKSATPQKWSYFVNAYLEEAQANLPPPPRPRDGRGFTTVRQEMEYLESYLQVERGSVERIEGERYFAGLEEGVVKEWGRRMGREQKEVRLREGWWEVCGWLWRQKRKMEERKVKVKVGVISVNWSKEWIRGVLEGGWEGWKETHGRDEMVVDGLVGVEGGRGLGELEIYANEFIVDPETRVTTGEFSRRKEGRGLWTAGDKVEVFDEVLALWGAERDGDGEEKGTGEGETVTVYVGDSGTDLGCLLRANVGVVVGANRELGEKLGRLGVRVVEGMEGARRKEWDEEEKEGGRRKRLYRIRDFGEMLRWLEGLGGGR